MSSVPAARTRPPAAGPALSGLLSGLGGRGSAHLIERHAGCTGTPG